MNVAKIVLFLVIFFYNVINSTEKKMANFIFKQVAQEDLSLLYNWFKEPHVDKWWPVPQEKEDFFASFLTRIRKGTIPYLAIIDSKPIGYVQTYPITAEHTWLPIFPENTIGTDQFIGDINFIGKGFGTIMLKDFIKFISAQDKKIKSIIVDPDPANVAAIRCYDKVGFKVVGNYQIPYGTDNWGPSLVMRYDIGDQQ